jgi:hypothetical protein
MGMLVGSLVDEIHEVEAIMCMRLQLVVGPQ